MIGSAVRRVEDQRFLTGSGRFIDDFAFPGELHCALVRSPHPHARIQRIEFPKNLLVLTGRDMEKDAVGPMRAGWELPGMVEPPRWALARDTVRHAGEPVAAVFAQTKALAEDAAERVTVQYEPVGLIKNEVCFRWTRGDLPAVEAAFATAPHRVDIELVNNRLCGAALEARGTISTGDTLYCATQAPHHIRRHVCEELGLDEGEIRVLIANPDIAAIYAANDDVALGAAQAVAAAGKKGKVFVSGMNGIPPALRAVKDGSLGMTVELNPVTWGRLGVDMMADYLKGKKHEQRVFIKHELVDAKNIDAKLPKK